VHNSGRIYIFNFGISAGISDFGISDLAGIMDYGFGISANPKYFGFGAILNPITSYYNLCDFYRLLIIISKLKIIKIIKIRMNKTKNKIYKVRIN
jgi:hypothetical protein